MTLIKRIEPTVTGFTCYLNNTRVGDRATEIEAHDYLNELAYDVERGAPLSFEPVGMAQDMPILPYDVGSADTAGAAHTERGTTMTTVTKRTKATATEYITHSQTEDANDQRTSVEARKYLDDSIDYIDAEEQLLDPKLQALARKLADLPSHVLVETLHELSTSGKTTPQSLFLIDSWVQRLTHRAYGPQIDVLNGPQPQISTLIDGSPIVGTFDFHEDQHTSVMTTTLNGWRLHSDDSGLDMWHPVDKFNLEGITRENLPAFKAFINSGAIEHMLTCGEMWCNNVEDVPQTSPASIVPAVELSRWMSIENTGNAAAIAKFGMAEFWIDEKSGIVDMGVNGHLIEADALALADAVMLLNSPQVRQMRERAEAGLPPFTEEQIAILPCEVVTP